MGTWRPEKCNTSNYPLCTKCLGGHKLHTDAGHYYWSLLFCSWICLKMDEEALLVMPGLLMSSQRRADLGSEHFSKLMQAIQSLQGRMDDTFPWFQLKAIFDWRLKGGGSQCMHNTDLSSCYSNGYNIACDGSCLAPGQLSIVGFLCLVCLLLFELW